MLITISNIFSPNGLESAHKRINKLEWKSGLNTAGKTAKQVKKNFQADLSQGIGAVLQSDILNALQANAVLQAAAQPKSFSKLLISKTENGGFYGAHIDNALMNTAKGKLRTDLSFTLFLSKPNSYDGGELIVQYPGFTQTFKPEAGDLVLYPSRYIHEVTPVTRGTRLACVGWVESLIPQQDKRETLFDLINLRASLSHQFPAQSAELMTLNKTISNLLRLWAQP